MPIAGIEQPEVIVIDDTLRLRKYDGNHHFALAWYQDEETVWMVDGCREPYTEEKLQRMYAYLDAHGELYWIEQKTEQGFCPIGDVTFWQEDMPIVIGEKTCRGCGVALKVVQALIDRGRMLGYDHLEIGDIYAWNEPSRRCFTKAGFRRCGDTEKGHVYRLDL